MHSISDNIEIMIHDEADEVVEEHFDLLKNRYQNNLESMKSSEFVFDYVQLLYFKCQKVMYIFYIYFYIFIYIFICLYICYIYFLIE